MHRLHGCMNACTHARASAPVHITRRQRPQTTHNASRFCAGASSQLHVARSMAGAAGDPPGKDDEEKFLTYKQVWMATGRGGRRPTNNRHAQEPEALLHDGPAQQLCVHAQVVDAHPHATPCPCAAMPMQTMPMQHHSHATP
eukprot:353206-Chlamydomonas_euryale.AAC.3